jgi:hypothetical protein
MDLFTEHYARHVRDAVDLDIDLATKFRPLMAATTKRPRRRLARTVSWLRATLRPTRRPTGTARPAITSATTAGT